MNIMAKLTLRHLRENMKRTIVTILGIVMATALISAILLGVYSSFDFFGYISTRSSGNLHTVCYFVTQEQYELLKADDRIKYIGLSDVDMELTGIRLCTDTEERFRVGNIINANQDYYSAKVTGVYDGTLPTNAGEVAVEQRFLDDNGLSLGIGDTLTFEIGNRYSCDEQGEKTYWAGNYRGDESFDSLGTVTCTITAILHDNMSTKGYDVMRGLDADFYPETDNAVATITLKNCDHTADVQLNDILGKCGITHFSKNSEYLISKFSFEGGNAGYMKFFSVMFIGLAIVVATSVVLIVNSFGMSLAERMKYLGMLASVGATSRQKRFSVYFEGLVLGIIGIPLGILAGLVGTKITLFVLGSKIIEADMITDAKGITGGIPLVVSPIAILAIVAVSGITIMISVLAPSIRASKIMPVEALRQTNTIKVKARKLRANPLLRKIFGYEGELAYKNIKRNGFKATVISVSITISVILFLTIDYFCDSIDKVNKYDFEAPYQVYASCDYDQKDSLYEALSAIEGTDEVHLSDMVVYPFAPRRDARGEIMDTVIANTDIADPSFRTDDYKDLKLDGIVVIYVDDAVFSDFLEKNSLDPNDYFGDTLRGVLVNSYFHKKNEKPVFNESIIGQILHYDEEMGNPPAVEIGDLVAYGYDNYAWKMVPKETLAIIVPESIYFSKALVCIPNVKHTVTFGIITDEAEEVAAAVEELFAGGEYENFACGDLTRSLVIMNTVTLVLKTSMYGFTVLLTLIAVANIVNTISTGVLMRRKEFAMYRSVGMNEKGFKKMIVLETFLYGIRAVLIGIPVSILLCYSMYSRMEDQIFEFTPNFEMYPVVIAVVFGVIALSMLMSINKIKNDEIIDVLKEDIC